LTGSRGSRALSLRFSVNEALFNNSPELSKLTLDLLKQSPLNNHMVTHCPHPKTWEGERLKGCGNDDVSVLAQKYGLAYFAE
jgi:hypothetical protein